MGERTYFRSAAVTTEQVVFSGRCKVYHIMPELTTTGTLTVRDDRAANADAAKIAHVAAIGLSQAGYKDFEGAVFKEGLTFQQSVGTDRCTIVYEPY